MRVHSAALGVLVGLGCIALLLHQVDLKQSLNALGRLDGPFFLISAVLFFLNLSLRAWRWQTIFPPSSRPGMWQCVMVLGIGNMANFLLPGRAGDVARCVLLGNEGSLASSSRVLATLAVEKVLDGMTLVAMVLFSICALQPPHWLVNLLRVAIAIFGGALLLLVLLRYQTPVLIGFVRKLFHSAHRSTLEGKFDALLTSFAEGLCAVTSAGQMVRILLVTAAIWVTEGATIWGIAAAFSIVTGLKAAMIATAVLGLGFMIPAAPGGLGTYELFGTEAFNLAGVTVSSALALTVAIHAWVFVANLVVGVCLLAVKGINVTQLRSHLGE